MHIVNANRLVYLCFFFSGVSALIYEIVWARMLTTVFGASLYAVATITGVFLGGLALGALIATKLIPRLTNPIAVYAALEVAIAVCGAALPFVFGSTSFHSIWIGVEKSVPFALASYLARFVFACVVLLPPTMLMGATLPILVSGLKVAHTDRDPAQTLYASNTTGGALGALLSGFVLLPLLGLIRTSFAGCALNLVAAVVAMIASKTNASAPTPAGDAPSGKARAPIASAPTIYGVAFLSGLLLLTLEICWTRWFSLLLGSSVYSLSCVLCLFLISLAIGAWLVQSFLQKLGSPLLLMASAYFASCTYLLITLYCANELPWLFLSLAQGISNITGGFSFGSTMAARFFTVGLVTVVPAVLMGMVLPLLFGEQSKDKPSLVGRLYAVNTLGSICGAWITGFLLIPALSRLAGSGIQSTILLCIGAQLIIAMWLFIEWSRSFVTDKDTRSIVIGIAVFVAAAVGIDVALFRPDWNTTIMSAGASFYAPQDLAKLDRDGFLATLGVQSGEQGGSTVFYREGLNATVTVGQDERRNVSFLKTDGKVEAAIPTESVVEAQGADTSTHLVLGALPPALTSADKKSVLVIGYGSGTTSGAVLMNPGVLRLTIAELEEAVYAANKFFQQSNGDPLAQTSRVRPLVNDGRYVLASSDTKYDAIICQPSDPWVSGAAELFTSEFWQLAKSKLNADGVISQWVQLYSINPEHLGILCRTFSNVFPNCALVWTKPAGECVLIGTNSAKPMTAEQIQNAVVTESMTGEHLPAGYRSLSSLLNSATVLGADQVKRLCETIGSQTGNVAVNTDDRNQIEFAAARNAMSQQQNIQRNIDLIHGASESPAPLSR